MTPEMQGPPPFETRCPRCKVSYPIETRRCIHCGGRTERPAREAAQATSISTPGSGRLGAQRPREATRAAQQPMRAPAPQPAPPARAPAPRQQDEEDDDELPVRSGMTRGLGLVWVALAIAASLYRACTGEGPG